MAESTDLEQILGKRISTLKDLKDAIKEYKDTLASVTEGTAEWDDATTKLNAAQMRLDKITKAGKGTLDQYNKSEKDSINTLKQRIKELNTERNAMDMNSKEYKEATKELKVLNDKLRESGTSAGDWRANVGNYANSIKSAFGELGSAAGGLTGPLGAVNASMLKLAANPVGAAIMAIVAALGLLAHGIKSSEENTNKFNEILAPLKGILELITNAIQTMTGKVLDWVKALMQNQTVINVFKTALQTLIAIFIQTKEQIEAIWDIIKSIGSGIWSVLKPVFQVIGKISSEIFQKIKPALEFVANAWNKLADTKLGRALGFNKLDIKQWGEAWEEAGDQVEEFADKAEKAAKTMQDVAKQEAALLKRKRDLLVANAKINGEIAKLDLEIAEERNKEVKDYDKILDLINEKTAKEQEKLKNDLALKQAELAIIQQRNSLSQNNTKDLDAEAQAMAAVVDAQNALTLAQANGEKEKTRIIKAKTAQKQKEETEAYKNAVNDLNIALKALDLQYNETMDAMQKAPEAPQGADIDTESINAYYDAMNAAYEAEYQAYAEMTDGKIAKLQEFIDTQKALGQDVSAQELEIANLRRLKDKEYNKMRDNTQKNEKARTLDQKKNFNATVSAYGAMMDSMSSLFEENTVAYKLTATAKALIDTFLAANAVLAEQQGGVVARVAAMAAVIAAGVANVTAIWKVNPKDGGSSPSASESAVAQAPAIVDSTPYTYTRSVQTEEEEQKLNQPMYVSVTDINDVQNRVKVTEEESTW